MTMPFHGEMMTCVTCGKQEKSDPRKSSGWTTIQLPGSKRVHYVCPACIHEPAKKIGYKLVYDRLLRHLIELEKQK